MKRALFIDRDGVINVDKTHVFNSSQFEFTDGIFDLCKRYYCSGYRIIVITNQAGIAKGLYTEDDFQTLTSWMINEFKRNDIPVLKVYYCPHHPDFTGSCDCRKPEPGMICKAVKEFSLDISECVLIGDKDSDIEAGRRAGIPESNLLLLTGTPKDHLSGLPGKF